MLFKKGIKLRIYPDAETVSLLESTFGCCRKVWNTLLGRSIERYELYKQGKTEKPKISPYDFQALLVGLKQEPEFSYLNDVSSRALQIAAAELGKAYQRFFKDKKGYPKFKSKHNSKASFSLTTQVNGPSYFKIVDKKLYIAKSTRPIEVVWHRELPTAPTQVTISKDSCGDYYASFLCEADPQLTNGRGSIGIDLGVKTFATFSDGREVENPRYFVKAQDKLAHLQRQLFRKKKGSQNREKARKKVAKQHRLIARQREHFLHTLSRRLVNENQVITIEDLNVRGMMKNRRLAKHIGDASFGMFRRLLEQKVIESYHTTLVVASRWYPSTQQCYNCFEKPKEKLSLKTRSWICHHCGIEHRRDLNAAVNLKQYGDQLFEESMSGKIVLAKAVNLKYYPDIGGI